MRRVPHVLLTEQEVFMAVDFLLGQDEFVIDLETAGSTAAPNAALDTRTNQITWFALGSTASVFLIPVAHPKGVLLEPGKTVAHPACVLFPESDERHWTPGTKDLPLEQRRPSKRAVSVRVPPRFAPAPEQLDAGTVARILRPLLFSYRAKIGHNLKFDLLTLAKYYGGEIPPGPYHDTILLQHFIQEEGIAKYGLKELAVAWYRPADPKTWYPKLAAQGLEQFGLDEAARYVAKDIRYCWMFKQRLWKRLERQNLVGAYEFEMEVYRALMEMEQEGFPIQEDLMDHVGTVLDKNIAAVEDKAWKMAGQFPLSNLRAKRWVLFGFMEKRKDGSDLDTVEWIDSAGTPIVTNLRTSVTPGKLKPLAYTGKTHLPQLNQAMLTHYADRHPMASLLSEWSSAEKLRSTFITGLKSKLSHARAESLPRLHSSLNQHGTRTGRLSSSNPNLQQIPRGSTIREMFVAGPGHVLIVADYDQVELRCAGFLSGDREMLKVFRRGDDIHRQAAAAMYHIPLGDITDEQRSVGKTQNFAVLYGAGEAKIATVAKCSKQYALQLINGYYKLFSQLEPWKLDVLKEARARCDPGNMAVKPPYVLIPPTGRRRRLPMLMNFRSGDEYERYQAERQAINAVVQGFASNIAKSAMLSLRTNLVGLPGKMILQVHDEIIVKADERHADEVLAIVRSSMEGVRDLEGAPILGDVPLVASVKVGYSWAEAKGK